MTFLFTFYEVILIHDLGHGFNRLVWVDFNCFFFFFFSALKTRSVENWDSYVFFTFFLSDYLNLMAHITSFACWHYQKIDKYKRRYRGNIFIGKFLRDFTDGNIPSVYTEGITVGKKLKQSKKKMMTCHFYQRNYRRNTIHW